MAYAQKGSKLSHCMMLERRYNDLVNGTKASKQQDHMEHKDGFYEDGQSYDYKSPKQAWFKGERVPAVWLELYNSAGNHGWLFGETDIIAMHFADTVYEFKREDLKNYMLSVMPPYDKNKVAYGYKSWSTRKAFPKEVATFVWLKDVIHLVKNKRYMSSR